MVIGLTGCFASGKSEAANLFKKLGMHVIDADLLAREATSPRSAGLNEIKRVFGENFINPDGSLNRPLIAKVVFDAKEKLKLLENIIHPIVRSLFLERLHALVERNAPPPDLVLFVVPLLFESRIAYPEISKIITVSAPKEICILRAMKRDGISRAEAEQRLKAQLPSEEKEKLANWVIRNDQGREHLEAEVSRVFNEIIQLKH